MRDRTVENPAGKGVHHGVAYALWLPDGEPAGGVVIIHGAGSCKESHFDFGRAARAMGLAAVAFDQRGHGETGDRLDDRAIDDVASIADLLPPGPVALRGSSMGGYLALIAAAEVGARAVVAICPASSEQLLGGLEAGRFEFDANRPALERLLLQHDVRHAVRDLEAPLLLMHAQGDDQIPVEQTKELYGEARTEVKRLIVMPGGHHRSIQHDPELQGESLRFVLKALRSGRDGERGRLPDPPS